MKKTFLIMLVIILATGVQHAGAYASKHIDTVAGTPKLTIGKALPVFNLQNSVGKAIKTSSVKGKVVLIDFWASWCMPCRASIPHLKELYKKYHSSGFEILSVSIDQNSKAWKNAILKEAMPWQQGIDKYAVGNDASVMMNALGIQSVPFAVLLDNEGKVVLINPEAAGIDDYLNKIFKK